MILAENLLTLSIQSDRVQTEAFQVSVRLNGQSIAPMATVTQARYLELHPIIDAVRQLLKKDGHPTTADDTLVSAGVELFDVWLAPFWSEVEKNSLPDRTYLLTIASPHPDVLLLPWEALRLPNGVILGLDSRFGVRRLPGEYQELPHCCPTLLPGPLKVLSMACAPANSGTMDAFAEENSLRQAVGKSGQDLFLAIAHSGTFAELESLIHDFQPHVVHLSGPALIKQTLGFFGFEDDLGNADIRTVSEMTQELFKNSTVQCVVVSGHDREKPPPLAALASIAKDLVSNGMPLALAWGEALNAHQAGTFAETFYLHLAQGKTFDNALTQARRRVLADCQKSGRPGWLLPMAFSANMQTRLFNTSPTAIRIQPRNPHKPCLPQPGLFSGYAQHYQVPRRSIQRLFPRLRDGSLQSVLLVGDHGTGKTTLANDLAHRLQQDGFHVVALGATAVMPISTGRILATFAEIFQKYGLVDEHEILNDSNIGVEDRLGFLAAVMNRRFAFVLVLDGLELSLVSPSGRFQDPGLAAFYFYLLDQLGGLSRLIVTSSIRPVAGGPAPPLATFREESLGDQPWKTDTDPTHLAAALAEMETKTHRALAQMALFPFPFSVDDLATLTGRSRPRAQQWLHAWLAANWVHPCASQGMPTWIVSVAVRQHFSQNPEIDPDEIRKYHQSTGKFLLTFLTKKTTHTLAGSWLDVAIMTVMHFLQGGLFSEALQTLDRVNDFFSQTLSSYELERINALVLTYVKHPRPLLRIALALLHRDQYLEARETFNQVVDMASEHFPHEAALALFDLGSMDIRDQQPDKALEKFSRAVEFNRAYANTAGEAACLAQMGMVNMHGGNQAQALVDLSAALAIYVKMDQPQEMAKLLPWIGEIYFQQGEYVKARQYFQEALPLLTSAQQPTMRAQILHQLATIDLNEALDDQALVRFQESLHLKRELDDRQGEAAVFYQLGRLAKKQGLQEACLKFLGLCFRIDQEINNPDAEKESAMFHEIAQTMGFAEGQAHAILAEIWEEYQKNRGQSLIDQTFTNV